MATAENVARARTEVATLVDDFLMREIEISCMCDAVRVRITDEPVEQFYCHCDDCQAGSGGAYIGVALFPASAVKVTHGELHTFTYRTLPRQRCAKCGTHVLAMVPGIDQVGVKANLLPRGMFQPRFHIQCQYAVLPVRDNLPHYRGFPPHFGGTDEKVDW